MSKKKKPTLRINGELAKEIIQENKKEGVIGVKFASRKKSNLTYGLHLFKKEKQEQNHIGFYREGEEIKGDQIYLRDLGINGAVPPIIFGVRNSEGKKALVCIPPPIVSIKEKEVLLKKGMDAILEKIFKTTQVVDIGK